MGDVESSEIDVTGRYANPCGETVDLTGTARVIVIGNADAHGGTHQVFLLNYQGVSGFGETTGASYASAGMTSPGPLG